MRGFNEELAERLLKIESVRFDRNPFICDLCHLAAILDRQAEVTLTLERLSRH